uniref:hypothetical protein n=1 Tax=uncultured Erythrobacter sp. TaxID=263913 RepID=UPI002601DB43|nr:hypothetical protein [uncultured Erythrobacter sp.]
MHPLETQGMLWGYTGTMWNRDMAIVILFSLFTIALIPIVWIYFVASPIARWIVVFFGIVRLWPFLADPSYILAAAAYVPMELAAPILQIIAIALLFTPSSRLWFANENIDAETI